MLPSSDLSLISIKQPRHAKTNVSENKVADGDFQYAMREANNAMDKKRVAADSKQNDNVSHTSSVEKNEKIEAKNTSDMSNNESNQASTSQNNSQSSNADESHEHSSEDRSSEEHSAKNSGTKSEQEALEGSDATIVAGGEEQQSTQVDNNVLVDANVTFTATSDVSEESLANNLTALTKVNSPNSELLDAVVADGPDSSVITLDGKGLQGERPIDAELLSLESKLTSNADEVAKVATTSESLSLPVDTLNKDSLDFKNIEKDKLDLNVLMDDLPIEGNLKQVSPIQSVPGELINANALTEESIDDGSNSDIGSSLSSQLAGLLNLNGISKEKKSAGSPEVNSAEPLIMGDVTALSNNSDSNNLANSESPVELDWILQQMVESETPVLANNLSDGKVSPSSSASSIVINNTDLNKSGVLSPLGMGNDLTQNDMGEFTDLTLLDNDSLNVSETVVREQNVSKSGLGESSVPNISAMTAQSLDAKSLQQAAPLSNPTTTNLTMQVPPSHPNWGAEMGEKLVWISKQGIQKAEIHLDPPELGSLTVKIAIDADSASVSFVVASSQVKDLLDGQVQRLREMLAQQNIDLDSVDVDVSRQGANSSHNDANGSDKNTSDADANELESMADEENIALNSAKISSNRVDFYA